MFSAIPHQDKIFLTPALIQYHKGKPSWILLERIEPDLLLDFYDQFRPARLDATHIDQIITGITSYQVLPQRYPHLCQGFSIFNPDNTVVIQDYFQSQSSYLEYLLGQRCFQAIKNFLLSCLKVWSQHNKYLVHGDLALHNIGFKNGKLLVLDWEHAHISNPAYDFAKLYTQSWQYPEWRKNYMAQLLKIYPFLDFKTLFESGVIIWSLSEIRHLEKCIRDEKYGYSRQLKRAFTREQMVDLFKNGILNHKETIIETAHDS